MKKSAEERFWSSINKTDTCWLWTGNLSVGYGYIYAGGKTKPAHRYSHELLKGPIPEGLEVDHLCRVRNCVNPDHLEAVTQAENVRRANPHINNGECKNGHTRKNHKKRCQECRYIWLGKRREPRIYSSTVRKVCKYEGCEKLGMPAKSRKPPNQFIKYWKQYCWFHERLENRLPTP